MNLAHLLTLFISTKERACLFLGIAWSNDKDDPADDGVAADLRRNIEEGRRRDTEIWREKAEDERERERERKNK